MSQDKTDIALLQELEEHKKTIAELLKTIDGLNQMVEGMSQTIDALSQMIDDLSQTVKELSERLGMNSKNSSKPPSSDGPKKPSPKSLRKPSGKKTGGQPGHPGSFLEITAEPDEVMVHPPSVCLSCPRYDVCAETACVGEVRRMVDAMIAVKITAHQSLSINCPLRGIQLKGEFPDNIKATVQYGENLNALTVAMNTIGAVSLSRTQEILSGVFGIPLSTGTITNMVNRCAMGLNETVEWIRQKIIASDVAHFDETGTRVDGKNHWVHNASTRLFTHLTISKKRGKEGMDAAGVLSGFSGIPVHDCWLPYWRYPFDSHGLCNAHLLRELEAAKARAPDQGWAKALFELLLEMKKVKEEAVLAGKWSLSEEQLQGFGVQYDKVIKLAYEENPPPEDTGEVKKRGRKKKGKTLSLIERLDKHKESVCLFVHRFEVPFDNNQAERDCRMIKTKTKVSGCFRSLVGAENYLKVMSYVGTAKKHRKSGYEAIRQAVMGTPLCFEV